MRELLADLHIHTVLSPCAEVEMIPPLIVARALQQGLGLIAITDHNAAGNCAAVMEAARGSALVVLPGMEIQTREEVHLLALFDTPEQADACQCLVLQRLPDRRNPEEVLGPQYVVTAQGDHVRTEGRLLLCSADLALEEAIAAIVSLGGLAIPAHVDRPAYGLLANLGMIPLGLGVPALELFRLTHPAAAIRRYPELAAWPLVRSSDAHRLAELAPTLSLRLAAPSIGELLLALASRDGRGFCLAEQI